MDKRIKLIRSCTWEEVFLFWYKNEGENPNWIQLAKERGYASWADWRIQNYAKRFECSQAQWGLYEITYPSDVIIHWIGGPFSTWMKRYYGGAKTKIFSELAIHPDILNHAGIKSIKDHYPQDSVISAMELSDGKIVIVEGMHRACALAIMQKEGRPFTDKLIFAIGKTNLNELPASSRDI